MKSVKLSVLVIAASVAMASAAQAGGFNRGSANLDGLFSDKIGVYSGVTYVAPGRSYNRVTGARIVSGNPAALSQNDVEFGKSFTVPYASVGGQIVDSTACVGSYSQPYGADSKYSGDISYHIAAQSLATYELGLTCAYRMNVGKGRLSFIGGVFNEHIKYHRARNFNLALGTTGDSTIDLESDAWGYRVGLAYDIEEIALKASLMYRSQTNYNATGNYNNTPFAALVTPILGAATANLVYGTNTATTAKAKASLPQSVELALQTGVAEGWLVYGSVKWTDWSILKSIDLVEGIANSNFSTARFFFKDGWTVTGGVAHRFNEKLAVSGAVTWDKGVTSGWDTMTDTWTFSGGAAFDVNKNIQIRAGGAAIHFASGTKSKTSSTVDYTATSPSEWGYALSLSANMKF